MKKVKQIDIKKNMIIDELIKEMSLAGVMGAGSLAKSICILEKMILDKDCKIFMGVAGALVPAGMKNIIIEMLKQHWIDVLVITGANLTHDLIEALGHSHYQGTHLINDSKLYDKKIDRMYNSFMKNDVYKDLEDFFEKNFNELARSKNIKEFLWQLGKITPSDSILHTCYKEKIPIFCPAISDSGIGLMIWGRLIKGKKISIDTFDDLKEILDISWTAKKKGVFYLGGGFPKNYIQQAMQFSDKSANYGVQITLDRPEYGGSSGAELREGISWGKLEKNADYIDLICDITIALPIIHAALKSRLNTEQ